MFFRLLERGRGYTYLHAVLKIHLKRILVTRFGANFVGSGSGAYANCHINFLEKFFKKSFLFPSPSVNACSD